MVLSQVSSLSQLSWGFGDWGRTFVAFGTFVATINATWRPVRRFA